MQKRDIRIEPYKYYNTKRLEQVENAESRIVISYDEIAEVNTIGMYKLKDVSMINMMIDLVPDSAKKEMMLLFFTSNRENIFIDSSEHRIGVSKFLAKKWGVSEEAVRKALRYFTKQKWIYRLNKYQYMSNPYYIVRNDVSVEKVSVKRVSELQKYWDRLKTDDIRVPIEWNEDTVDDMVTKDITKIPNNIKLRQEEVIQNRALKAEQVKEDTLDVQGNLKVFKAIFESFREHNGYDKVDTKVRTHFKAYLNTLYTNHSSIVDDLPKLYLTSIKPFKQLESK